VFDEVRFDLRLTPDGSVSVHATSKVLPEEWVDTATAEQLDQLRLLRGRLAKHQITEAELVRMGLLLGDALVPDSIQEPLARRVASPDERGVRLRIVAHDAELSALPWEYVRLPSRFDELGGAPLALDERVSLVRSPAKGSPATNPTLRGRPELRVLHASSTSVEGYEPLRGDDHAVDLALWGESGNRRTRRVVVDRLSDPATRESLEEALSASPDLFVFTGHSTSEDGRASLVLAGDDGRPDLVGGPELAAMLLRAGTPLVVLNACDTATSDDTDVSLAEQLVRSGVGTAIGMQMPISDSNAGHFAVGLVGALGEGLPVDVAVTQGRRRVADRAGFAEWGIPTLVSSSRVDEPLDGVEPTTRSGELVGAAAAGGDVPRGGPSPTLSRTSTTPERGAPSRRPRGPLIGALAALLLVLVGGGYWLFAGDDGTESPPDPEVAGDVEERQDPRRKGEFPDDGFHGHQPLSGSSATDTSEALRQVVERVGASLPFTTADGTTRVPDSLVQIDEIPPTPFAAEYYSTNLWSTPECWKVHLSSVTVLGYDVAAWADTGQGRAFTLAAIQLGSSRMAQQYYWATSLYPGPRRDHCSGWPVDGVAEDPTKLKIDRNDLRVQAPAHDLMIAAETKHLGDPGLTTAYQTVFRLDDTVVVTAHISTGSLDLDEVRSDIERTIELFAQH